MSVLNKKLPKVSDICFTDYARSTRKNVIEMIFDEAADDDRIIPKGVSYACWKQSSFTYGYQAQYRVRARLVPSKQLSTGKTESKTEWKHINPDWDASKSIDNLNRFMLPDKGNQLYRYLNFGGKELMPKANHDMLSIDIRVRSFSNSAKQHGVWETGTVTVKCKPKVVVREVVAFADGGLRFYFDLGGWKRGGSKFSLTSVVVEDELPDGTKVPREALKGSLRYDYVDALGDEDNGEYPYAGFLGGCFNEGFRPKQEIKFKGVFTTCDGIDVEMEGNVETSEMTAVVSDPAVTVTRDVDDATVEVEVEKSVETEDWDEVSAWILCDIDGKKVRFEPVSSEVGSNEKRLFKFMPPLDCPMDLHVSVSNDLKFSNPFPCGSIDPIPSHGRVMVNYTDGTSEQPDGWFNGHLLAVMNYNVSRSFSGSRAAESAAPFGRGKPIAFLGDAVERGVSLSGTVDATPDSSLATEAFSTSADWHRFHEQQGIVLLRMPHGEWMHALCTDASIAPSATGKTETVSLNLKEVDV